MAGRGLAAGHRLAQPDRRRRIGNDMLALNKYRARHFRSVHNAYLQYAVDLGCRLAAVRLAARPMHSERATRGATVEIPTTRSPLAARAGVQVSLTAFFVAAMFSPRSLSFLFLHHCRTGVGLHNTARAAALAARLFRTLPRVRRAAS
jgi:hypothetical protein